MNTNNKPSLLYTINSIPRMMEISQPLCHYLGIKLFGYTRIYNDCSYFKLSNGYEDYFTKHISNIITQDNAFINGYRNTLGSDPHFVLWPTNYKIIPTVASLHLHYNIWNGLSINYRTNNYIENFFFAFDLNSGDKSEFYMQNQQLLIKFCDYFKVMAKDLVNKDDKNILAKYNNEFDISPIKQNILIRDEFLEKIKYKKILSNYDSNGTFVQLTARESECVSLLMQGRTIKEISKIISLSPRTVEHYIENAKQKFGIRYKSQLLDILSGQ